ncbi:MAG: helix-turn-helix domain-containing protein [Clostridium paraputrificum]|nr:helix-turn-helix transcriptional regulator [Clostridium paraputrificum]
MKELSAMKKYLKKRNIKNSDLSNGAKVGEATVSQYLNGKRTITFNTACKISDYLDITLDELRKLSEVE